MMLAIYRRIYNRKFEHSDRLIINRLKKEILKIKTFSETTKVQWKRLFFFLFPEIVFKNNLLLRKEKMKLFKTGVITRKRKH